MSAVLERAALRLLRAPRGGRTAVAESIADELGCSTATVYTRLKPFLPNRSRKRREDAGNSALSAGEAAKIAAYIEATRRETQTGAAPLEEAVNVLRANGEILAGRVDESTGEFRPLSLPAIRRALRHHHMHPAQLAAPTPAGRLSSPHPNHCWQADASVSRQFYLADDGTQVMDKRRFYRGKPKEFEAIAQQRIWRYAFTDHASGAIEVFYVQGAESASNFLHALIYAMTERSDGTMYGVPRYLMSDPGSAITAAATRNLCTALGIELIVNEAGNARAKGQVEQAHYIIETHFESGLKMLPPVCSIAEINGLAREWSRAYNATRVHSRHGMTRRDAWLEITPVQLVRAPSIAELRRLATTNPKPCTVRDYMIRFGGRVYDLRDIPGGVLNGQRVEVLTNALDPDRATVRVLWQDEAGQPVHYLAPLIERRAFGFLASAAEIGSEFRAPPETAADAARKQIEQLAMEVSTDAEAKAARKAKRQPFGGRIDPHKHLRETIIPEALPRAGRTAEVAAPAELEAAPLPTIRPTYTPRLLGHVELARLVKPLFEAEGGTWTPALYAELCRRWPQGAAEEQAAEVAQQLRARNVLRIAQ